MLRRCRGAAEKNKQKTVVAASDLGRIRNLRLLRRRSPWCRGFRPAVRRRTPHPLPPDARKRRRCRTIGGGGTSPQQQQQQLVSSSSSNRSRVAPAFSESVRGRVHVCLSVRSFLCVTRCAWLAAGLFSEGARPCNPLLPARESLPVSSFFLAVPAFKFYLVGWLDGVALTVGKQANWIFASSSFDAATACILSCSARSQSARPSAW